MALRSHISDLQHRLAGNLLLDVQIVILHVRRVLFRSEGEHVAFETTSRRRRVHRAAGHDGPAHGTRRENWRRSDVVIRRSRIKERRVRQVPKDHVLGERVEEDSVTGADHGLAFRAHIPRQADARSKIFLVWVIQAAQPWLSDLRQGKVSGSQGPRRKACYVAEQVVLLADYSEVVPAQPIIQRQASPDLVIVLGVETEVVFKCVASRVAKILKTAVHIAREKVLQWSRVAAQQPGSTEFQSAPEVLVEVLLYRGAVEVDAKLYVVPSSLPRKVVEHLVVAVYTVTRNAAGRAELSKAPHKNDRQTLIGCAGACIESDRTGLETLIPWEKPFRKAIPSISQFIHLVRSDRMHVRERN